MTPPRSSRYLVDLVRRLSALPRRLRICEERGTGIDKVVDAVEAFVAGVEPLASVHFAEGLVILPTAGSAGGGWAECHPGGVGARAAHQHACLRHVTRKPMTNSSLRTRFGIADRNASTASRVLADAVDAGLIVIADPVAGPRARCYLPFWAKA